MGNNRLIELAVKLNRQTVDGQIEWQLTANEGLFQASFADYSVILSQGETFNPEEMDYFITIFNDQGVLLEKVSDTEISKFKESDEPNIYRLMKQTYELSRRQAMGTEKAIDTIINELDDIIPF